MATTPPGMIGSPTDTGLTGTSATPTPTPTPAPLAGATTSTGIYNPADMGAKSAYGIDPSMMKDAYVAGRSSGDMTNFNNMIAKAGVSESGASNILSNFGYDPTTELAAMKASGAVFAPGGTSAENVGWDYNATRAGVAPGAGMVGYSGATPYGSTPAGGTPAGTPSGTPAGTPAGAPPPPPGAPAPAPAGAPPGYNSGAPVGNGQVSDDQIRQWLASHQGASDAQIAQVMDSYGVTPQRLAQVTGMSSSDITSRYNTAEGTIHAPGYTGTGPQNPGQAPAVLRLPDLNRSLQADQTIEGRMSNILATDKNGNYTNQVVRQAVDRAMQSYNARGMLNSSMAVQAGQEAAISKAIEIAGPDAQRAFDQSRANQDAINSFARDQIQNQVDLQKQGNQITSDQNLQSQRLASDLALQREQQSFTAGQNTQNQNFQLRQNYQTMLDNANARYAAAVNQINASNMNPADRDVAIAQAAASRDGDLTYANKLYAAQPNFQAAWLVTSVGMGNMTIDQITNPDTLANIANDPAQPQAIRDQAKARLASLPPPTPAPTPEPVPSGMISNGGGNGA